jgi:hypothetical protein
MSADLSRRPASLRPGSPATADPLILRVRKFKVPRYSAGEHRAALESMHVASAQKFYALAAAEHQLTVLADCDANHTKRFGAFDRHSASMNRERVLFQVASVRL